MPNAFNQKKISKKIERIFYKFLTEVILSSVNVSEKNM